MKNKSLIIMLIGILSFVAIILVWFMFKVINNNYSFKFSKEESNELIVDTNLEASISRVNINARNGNVYIKESANKDARIILYGNKDKTKYEIKDGVLTIKSEERGCFGICFNTLSAKIELYLPNDYEGNIEVNNNYGDIEIGKFNLANIKITADAGDVFVDAGKTIQIDNNFGDVKLNKAEKAILKDDCGDIDVGTVLDIKVKNSYGDITIDEILKRLEVEADCGDIEISDLSINENSTINNSLGDIKINKTNEIKIDAKTSLGDTTVNNSFNSSVTLTVRNSCGDIEIKN